MPDYLRVKLPQPCPPHHDTEATWRLHNWSYCWKTRNVAMVTWPLMCFITSVLNNDVLLFDSCHATNLLLLFAAQFWYYRATPWIFNGAISVKWLCSDRSTNTTLMHHHFEATLNFPVCLCSEENANKDSAVNPFGECVFDLWISWVCGDFWTPLRLTLIGLHTLMPPCFTHSP